MPRPAKQPDLITRREAIKRVSALLGGAALIGADALLNLVEADEMHDRTASAALFTGKDIAFLDEVAETILPETSTPGARAAGVGPFMALMVTDAYDEDEQKIFRAGMLSIDAECLEMCGFVFMQATAEQRLSLLERLDREQSEFMKSHVEETPAHYFRMMKELALLGYFTSEIGCTQAMRYVETPGRFDPCLPYTAGDKAWARHA